MREESFAQLVFLALIQFLFHFFQREMHHVMVVQLFGSHAVAEAQPQAVQQVDFVGGEVRRMRAKDFVDLVAVRQMDFQIELRLGIGELFPRFADLASLLFALPLAGSSDDDGRRLQTVAGAKNTVPEVIGGDHRQANGLAALFRHGKSLGKQMLFDAAEELIGFKFLLARGRTAQDSDVQYHDVAAAGLHAVQHIPEVIHVEVIADRHQDVAGFGADGFRSQLAFELQVELVHFHVGNAGVARAFFRYGENDIEDDRENAASHGGDGLGEKVDDGDKKQRQRDEPETQRKLRFADREVQRHLKLALAGIGIAQDEHREAVHRKAPDHAESIEVC